MERFFKKARTSTLPPSSNANSPSSNLERARVDVDALSSDPGERKAMSLCDFNLRDEIRRSYIQKGHCQPRKHEFLRTGNGKNMRRFNVSWFDRYPTWLEYSIKNDAAYCLDCYLFKDDHFGVGDSFTCDGFKNWNHGLESLAKHVGSVPNSVHKQCAKKREDLMTQNQSIQTALNKHSDQAKVDYLTRILSSVEIVRVILCNAMPFRGHDESNSSRRKGVFLSLLQFYANKVKEVGRVTLKNAPKNEKMTSPTIQKDIAKSCSELTKKAILEELGDEYFSILVDECRDVSVKQQMAIVLRYVNDHGEIMERLVSLVHVTDTCSKALKEKIYLVLSKLSLSHSRIRGQGYDGASNMKSHIGGLRALIEQDCSSAHYIHCFAHQIQLALVAVAHKNHDVGLLLELVTNVLNAIGCSYIRKDLFREKKSENLEKALNNGQVNTGRGLNQEVGLQRPSNTRWGSHFKTFQNIILIFDPILEVLQAIGDDSKNEFEGSKARKIIDEIQTFDFVFMLHLMKDMLRITNALSQALQRRDQDIVNAISLVVSAKRQLKEARNDGWDCLMEKVSIFCGKYDIELPIMDHFYRLRGKRDRQFSTHTNEHHYHFEVFNAIYDFQIVEMDSRFGEVSTKLLLGVACLIPSNYFSAFDKEKLLEMAQFYPIDFGELALDELAIELETFIYNVHDDERFANLNGLSEFSKKLVETKKHFIFPKFYLLVKLALILPVSTATVERVFSAMKIIKTDLRNSISDEFLNDVIIPYFEDDLFDKVSDDSVVDYFQYMTHHCGQLPYPRGQLPYPRG